ncbi:MAG: bile acid:sodium symporter family protein [Bacteroidetes bacterium]|nr:bile acid:sodium symporter family protein [Bacteroidota bacterium]
MNLIDVLIPVVLALTMFGVGTSLDKKDFQRIAKHPKTIGLGLGLQMLFLPALAFLFALLLPIKPEWKLGLVILSLCPGGATSNFITYLLDLRTALSISLTSLNSIFILITIPLGADLATTFFLGSHSEMDLSFADTISNVIFVILLPAALGLLFHHRYTALSTRLKTPIKVTTTILLAIVFGIKFFAGEQSGGGDVGWEDIQVLLPITLVFHLLAMFFSYRLAVRMKRETLSAITIGIEVGLQNTTLALLVSSVILSSNEIAKPTLVYAIFSFFTTVAFGYLLKRRYAPPAA